MMLAFLAASILIKLTPGPNMAWLVATSASCGHLAGLAAVAGIALGLAFAGTVAAIGLSALLMSTPWLVTGMRWAGAVYLFYLTYEAWGDATQLQILTPSAGLPQFFWQGLISNVLNAKAYLFYAAILPQFLEKTSPVANQVAFLTFVYIAVATAIHAIVALLSGSLEAWLSNSRHATALRRAFALAIAATAVWFFYATRMST